MLEEAFRKAASPVIEHRGNTVHLYDEIAVPTHCTLSLQWEGTDSEWRQGIFLGSLSPKSGTQLRVGGVERPGFFLWEDTCPVEVLLTVRAPQGSLLVYNVWDTGDGRTQSQLQGAGMLVEESEEGRFRRYRCNDGHLESTFTHLTFSLRVVPATDDEGSAT